MYKPVESDNFLHSKEKRSGLIISLVGKVEAIAERTFDLDIFITSSSNELDENLLLPSHSPENVGCVNESKIGRVLEYIYILLSILFLMRVM